MMKIKHLLLLLLMFVGVSAKAQNWEWKGETPVAGSWYLYNVGQKGFLSQNENGSYLASNLSEAVKFTIVNGSSTSFFYTVGETTYYLYQDKGDNKRSTTSLNWTINKPDANPYYQIYSRNGDSNDRYLIATGGTTIANSRKSEDRHDWIDCWYFISEAQMTAYKKYIASETNIDMTFAIKNPSFETGNLDGWTNDGFAIHENAGKFEGNYIAEMWSADLVSGSIKQTLKSLPAGKYTLEAKVAAGFDGTQYIYAGNNKTYIEGKNGDPAQDVSVDFEISATEDVEIGFVRDNCRWWTGVDDWTLTLVAPRVKADMTVNSTAKYGTFCAPFEVTIPDGVSAYTVSGVSGNALVLDEVKTTIPANTPVILNAEGGLEETFYGMAVEGDPTAGLLVGTYTQIDAPAGSYILYNGEKGVGFYRVAEIYEKNWPKVSANRCYLNAPAQSAKMFSIGDGGATAIETVTALTEGKIKNIYNVNAAVRGGLQQGVNIVTLSNGKTVKIIVK